MPNHFHFLIYVDERVNTSIKQGGIIIDPLTNGIRKLLSSYARIFNKLYNRSGSLFRQKSKYKCLSKWAVDISQTFSLQDYYRNCFFYIHQNPLEAALVKDLDEWDYSSYKDYAGLRKGTLCNKELAVKYCGYESNSFIRSSNELIEENIKKEFQM
ncbi:transposase [Ferruginibacter sp. SUN002]|uniref:transposase n=1 Tax=Ferruginibacter sp. SUN002 TaxID=2937789 RepID=UPI003D36C6DE